MKFRCLSTIHISSITYQGGVFWARTLIERCNGAHPEGPLPNRRFAHRSLGEIARDRLKRGLKVVGVVDDKTGKIISLVGVNFDP